MFAFLKLKTYTCAKLFNSPLNSLYHDHQLFFCCLPPPRKRRCAKTIRAIKNRFFRLYSLVFLLSFSQTIKAQITLSLTEPPQHPFFEVGNPYEFRVSVSGLSQGAYVEKYRWEVFSLGNQGCINFDPNLPNPLENLTNATTNSITVTWGNTYANSDVNVSVTVEIMNANGLQERHTKYSGFHRLRGIGNVSISGSTSIPKCCTEKYRYCILNAVDADVFTWTVPPGWTHTTVNNGACIEVFPNTSSGGSITVRAGLSTANDTYCGGIHPYAKSAAITVLRPDPQVQISGPSDNLCPESSYTYSVQPACGATNYTWNAPPSWSQTSGQNTPSATFYLNQSALGLAMVSISVTYAGGCTATDSRKVSIISAPPNAPVFTPNIAEDGYTYYHCGNWWMCRFGGYMSAMIQPTTQRLEWEISAPWVFRLPGGLTGINTRKVTVPSLQYPPLVTNQPTLHYTPLIRVPGNGNPNIGGYVSVTASNCKGSSSTVVQQFNKELNHFCQGGTSCYPRNCACCLPTNTPCLPGPLSVPPQDSFVVDSNGLFRVAVPQDWEEDLDAEEKEGLETLVMEELFMGINDLSLLYPNPTPGIIYLTATKQPLIRLRLFDIYGRLLQDIPVTEETTEL